MKTCVAPVPYRTVVWIALSLVAIPLAIAADPSPGNWPQFRGPGGNGLAPNQTISKTFGPTQNLKWQVALPPGNSSPCIWGDQIFLTAHVGTTLKMLCLRRSDGTLLWDHERSISKLSAYEHVAGSPANSTPATDGQNVVFQFDDYGIVVAGLEGKIKWEKTFPSTENRFSYGASPVLDGDRLYINRDGAVDSSLLCLEAATGKERWKASRPSAGNSWCTPYVLTEGGTTQVLAGGSGRLEAYAAQTGEALWQVNGLPAVVCPSPVAANGLVFFGGWTTAHVAGRSRVESVFEEDSGVSAASMKDPKAFFDQFDANKDGKLSESEFPRSRARDAFNFIDKNKNGFVEMQEWAPVYTEQGTAPGRNVLLAVATGGKGDVTRTHVRWEATKGLPYVASPLVHEGRVYFVKTGGFLSCVDASTGKAFYESERLGVAGEYYATPLLVGRQIVLCAHRGTVLLVPSGDSFSVEARNEIGEGLSATPAVVGNTLYVRGEKHLWAFGQK